MQQHTNKSKNKGENNGENRIKTRDESRTFPKDKRLPSVTPINVSDAWFEAIQNRKKTVEGRLNKEKFAGLRVGSILVINRSTPNSASDAQRTSSLVAIVTQVVLYDSFRQFLEQEGLARTLPGVPTIVDGVKVYRQFYSAAKEKEHGVAAIHIRTL